ncbi:hypothetical protein WISP_41482 [Willisornis vidua]|uniref:Uncharacterized protein n=1 Tax=Willisornis vidua TaxID=1566151 RepID=A0ABQ9DL98_9PASS|nr:hypothetical protein WISP_41482 [Willisornis vidua]
MDGQPETAGNAPPLAPTLTGVPVMPGGWQGAKLDVTSWHSKKTLFKETVTSPGMQSAAGDLQPRVCGKSNDVLRERRAGTQTSITSLLTVEERKRKLPRSFLSVGPRRLLKSRCLGSMEIPHRFSQAVPKQGKGPLDGNVSVQEASSCFSGELYRSLSCQALEKLRD